MPAVLSVSAVIRIRTTGARLPSSWLESAAAPWRSSSVKVAEANCSVLRSSPAIRSAVAASSLLLLLSLLMNPGRWLTRWRTRSR